MFYLKELFLRSFYFMFFILNIIIITILFKKTLLNILFGGLVKFDEDLFTLCLNSIDASNYKVGNIYSEPLIILLIVFIFIISIYFLIMQTNELFSEEIALPTFKTLNIFIIIIIFFSTCLFIFPNIWIINESIIEVILNTYDGEILATFRNQNEYIFFLSECFSLIILAKLICYIIRSKDNIYLSIVCRDYNVIFLCLIGISPSSYLIFFLVISIFIYENLLLFLLIKMNFKLHYLLFKIKKNYEKCFY